VRARTPLAVADAEFWDVSLPEYEPERKSDAAGGRSDIIMEPQHNVTSTVSHLKAPWLKVRLPP
jgi:hypothetical protein